MQERRPPHPRNDLNELSGEEWLYFTKSVWSTAYPSELGHARRKAHGANKPPRLMAKLIEFFTKTGELVVDPFAGVGGTLLGRLSAARPRAAPSGSSWTRAGHRSMRRPSTRSSPSTTARGPPRGPRGPAIRAARAVSTPSGCELRLGDFRVRLRENAGRPRSTLSPPTCRTTCSCR
ncbi:MAG: DNA methyltransferase [Chloroflexota bacterium]